ncbi:hypothetical protein CPC08DRAFT_702720 [Agrocybe pediades]|nr:hypothetical protein CPC08DRAFT_702720 [Agrocybe pediades]
MFKVAFSFVLAALFAEQALAYGKTIPVGGLCAGIAGPVAGSCVSGSRCCNVSPDQSLCAAVTTCPSQFVPVGGLCNSIAGPSKFPCFPGTTCCITSPDLGSCRASC